MKKIRISAEYESQFYDRPFGIFGDLSDGIELSYDILFQGYQRVNALNYRS
jgi:hypothetical protein